MYLFWTRGGRPVGPPWSPGYAPDISLPWRLDPWLLLANGLDDRGNVRFA